MCSPVGAGWFIKRLNTFLANVTTGFLWFALVFWVFLETRSVLVTSFMGGAYMLLVAVVGVPFGTWVDRTRKRQVMLVAQVFTTVAFALALVLLMTTGGVPTIYAGDEFAFVGVKEERAGGDDAVRPEFSAPPWAANPDGAQMFALHQYLIGLRRRHPWLHTAKTAAVRLDNRQYLYETRDGEQRLLVALNIDDASMTAALPGPAELLAGSGAPPQQRVTDIVVPPHGWQILQPCLLYTSPSPRDRTRSRLPSSS